MAWPVPSGAVVGVVTAIVPVGPALVHYLPISRSSTGSHGKCRILADALQDAGCGNADILNHCRGDGPHVRGCWVVDLVLGKE